MREHGSIGKKLEAHPRIGIFSHEARLRTGSQKSTKKAMTEMPLSDRLSILYPGKS